MEQQPGRECEALLSISSAPADLEAASMCLHLLQQMFVLQNVRGGASACGVCVSAALVFPQITFSWVTGVI